MKFKVGDIVIYQNDSCYYNGISGEVLNVVCDSIPAYDVHYNSPKAILLWGSKFNDTEKEDNIRLRTPLDEVLE